MAGPSDDARMRGILLTLAGMAAFGWAAAFYALFDGIEQRELLANARAALEAPAVPEAKASLAEDSAALAGASAELAEIEAKLAGARAELEGTIRRRDDLEANIAALNEELAILSQRPTPVPAALEGPAREARPDERGRAESLDSALTSLDAAISERSAELVRMRRSRDDLEARIAAADAAYAAADRRLAGATREAAAAEARLSTLLGDVARLDDVAARRLEETRTLEADIARLRAEAARLRAAPAAEPAPSRVEGPAPQAEPRRDGARVIRVTPSFN